MKILLTGATGYIGGRLVPRLLEEGHQVRVLVRDPTRIAGRSWTDKVQICPGDLVQNVGLEAALAGVDAAYYLVHSMLAGTDFESLDRSAAMNFSAEAKRQNLKHVIYLGGLVPKTGAVSHHLKSRAEVGEVLRNHLPTTEFRAGPIIGSGSASFEMLRYLTERLPVMVAPKWIRNEIQPLAVRDVLSYLISALRVGPSGVVDVGADRLTFKEMMKVFAEARGLKRKIIAVPVLAPGLASRWVGLVTPIPNTIAVPIIEGIIQPLLADTTQAAKLFPEVKPISYKKAVELALDLLRVGSVETRWSNSQGGAVTGARLTSEEGLIHEVRSVKSKASCAALFRTFSSLGGNKGWLFANWAWEARGLFDRVIGGPGLRRGRRHDSELLVGESLDFWRVEEIQKDHLLRLNAEMLIPGCAWIQWEATPDGEGGSRLTQTASFAPRGLSGLLYWYSLYPIHSLIFSKLASSIAHEAEGLNK